MDGAKFAYFTADRPLLTYTRFLRVSLSGKFKLSFFWAGRGLGSGEQETDENIWLFTPFFVTLQQTFRNTKTDMNNYNTAPIPDPSP